MEKITEFCSFSSAQGGALYARKILLFLFQVNYNTVFK
jgi:predicted outer membrane repeat protein